MSQVFTLFYVTNVRHSAQFYADRLGLPILEESPGFAMLALPGGAMLGLWLARGVTPAPTGGPGFGELALTVADADALQARHADWQAQGTTILSPPAALDFGLNFLAADPDGHRLRIFVPA